MPNPIQDARTQADPGKMSDESSSYNAEDGAPLKAVPRSTPRDYATNPVNPPTKALPAKVKKG